MYILAGIIGMLIGGFIGAWVDIWMLGGFILGVLVYGVYHITKDLNNTSGTRDGFFGFCFIGAILEGIFSGL